MIIQQSQRIHNTCKRSSALNLPSSPLYSYVSLSDNEKTSYRARELKSVYVDAVGQYLKLTFHKNYANRYNLYSQVKQIQPPDGEWEQLRITSQAVLDDTKKAIPYLLDPEEKNFSKKKKRL